ncbi:hypothetical protein SALBM311S_09948 [Streptomyces alboniger]
MEGAVQVDARDAPPGRIVEPVGHLDGPPLDQGVRDESFGLRVVDARGVHDDVQPPVFAQYVLDNHVDRGGVRHVERHRTAGRQLLGDGLGTRAVHVRDDHGPCPLGGHLPGDRRPHSGGDADTVYFDMPTFGILKPVADAFRSDYEKWCAGCGYDKVDVPITAIGKDMPDRVVSYVRAHPKVTHIAFSLALLNVGVPAALRAAGLQNKVHTIVNVGESTNYQYIDSGQTQAAVAFNNIENAWAQADGLARHFTGQSMKPTQDAQLPFMLITKDTLISTKTQFPLVEDYQAQFKKLWGKS